MASLLLEARADPNDDAKTFKDKVLSFNLEHILLSSDKNYEKKKYLEKVVMTALVKNVSEVKGCSWLKEYFPQNYQHAFRELAEMKLKMRILAPLNKNENSNTDILDFMVDWYMATVEAKQEDRKQFKKDIDMMRN